MYTSTSGKNTVIIEFDEKGLEKYEALAELLGCSLRVFVAKAVIAFGEAAERDFDIEGT